jgi:hypothetical protein
MKEVNVNVVLNDVPMGTMNDNIGTNWSNYKW